MLTHTGKKKLSFTCDKKGKKCKDIQYGFDFVCQDPRKVCKAKSSCPFDCHYRCRIPAELIDRGMCLEGGKCQCNPFYKGPACGTFKGCPRKLNKKVCEPLLRSNRIKKKNLSDKPKRLKKQAGAESESDSAFDDDDDDDEEEEESEVDPMYRLEGHAGLEPVDLKRKPEVHDFVLQPDASEAQAAAAESRDSKAAPDSKIGDAHSASAASEDLEASQSVVGLEAIEDLEISNETDSLIEVIFPEAEQ